MKTVLVKMPRPIATRLLATLRSDDEVLDGNDTALLEAALKDAIASKPLNERE
jgi:hypothetical protein